VVLPVLAVAAWLMAAGPAWAQVTTGAVAGTVKDTQGGVLPGATVVLISETRGTQLVPVTTNASGDFVIVNAAPDTYTVEVTMSSFKTLDRKGIAISPGSRVVVGDLVLEVGGTNEVVNVTSEAPLIQAQSGERSYTATLDAVENLPISNRSFTALALLAPGVTQDGNQTPQRIGGGGDPNIMMDGVSTMDTGSNRPLLQMNVESIAEVKVLTSGYQAEYGRSSGVQVTAVTKSGSNRFHGSLYDVERHDAWNANTEVNILNGDKKPPLSERDWGYSIGGPVGKPGGNNKLFFFYAQEFSPRTAGGNVQQFRMPTALERQGDFSQTTDNLGDPFPYIRDPNLSGVCSASNKTGCFADGGVVGRIPADRLYQTGVNILNMYPLPNIENVPEGQNYNYQITRPKETAISYQPAVRIDYQATPALRGSFKYSAWSQRDQTFNGSLPGFNDAKMQHKPVVNYTASVNYTVTPTMFLEATYGHSQNELAGCAQAQSGTGPVFCTSALPVSEFSSLAGANLQGLPFLFPDAAVLNPRDYAVQALNDVNPPYWDASTLRLTKVPPFSWGNRVAHAPPSIGFPGWLNINSTHDFSASLTKVSGRHTIKGGFYLTHSYKAEQTSNSAFGSISFGQDSNNPFDTGFGFANAAIGTFQTFTQATTYAETSSIYQNTEWYIQDNWKVRDRWTLDYGLRFVHQAPQYDELGQLSNFLPDHYDRAAAPALYAAGCANGATACSGSNRQAMNPLTGELLGAGSTAAIGTLVPDTGDPLNGLFLPGQAGLPKATYFAPSLVVGPRFGTAYDLSGDQRYVLRGGVGIFYDRPSSTTFSRGVNNPPTSANVTVRYSQLQTLGQAGSGFTTQGAPGLSSVGEHIHWPTSTQWNGGIQLVLPFQTSLDVSYVGQHSWHQFLGVNINTVDLGSAYLPENQDPTLGSNSVPGATALSTNAMRAIYGYGGITEQMDVGWRTYHSIQVSFQRRFTHGLAFGFNDTLSLYDHQKVGPRLDHAPDGSFTVRGDQDRAQDLFGDNHPQAHIMRANFIWDLPDLASDSAATHVLAAILNDWQLSGVWAGSSGSAYSIGYSYQSSGANVNITGSPDFGGRVSIIGDPGSGCSSDRLRQFNTAAFVAPGPNSVGLESGSNYMRGCFFQQLDLTIARNIPLGGGRNVQFRLDMFNAPNTAIITGRQTSMQLSNPSEPDTPTNSVFNADGSVNPNRSTPRNNGFGLATGYQSPRTLQAQIRFSF
jgi:hypothetical protein